MIKLFKNLFKKREVKIEFLGNMTGWRTMNGLRVGKGIDCPVFIERYADDNSIKRIYVTLEDEKVYYDVEAYKQTGKFVRI